MGYVKDLWTKPNPSDPKGRRVHNDRWGRGKRWLAVWDDRAGGSLACTTKDAAEAELARHRVAGPVLVRREVTFAAYAEEWLPKQVHYAAESTRTARNRLAKMAVPHLGARPLASVTHADVQDMVVAWVEQNYAPATVRQAFSFITTLFGDAQQVGLIPASPCSRINLPAKVKRRVIPLTVAQVGEIRDAMSPWFASMVIVGAATGLRGGELRGLTVDRVINGDVIVDRQLVGRHGLAPVFDEPKSPAGFRRLAIGRIASEAIEEHLRRWPSDDLIWRTRQRGPVTRGVAAEAWHAATEGVSTRHRSGWHDLRHHHASILIRKGHSPVAVAERLGHEDESEVLRTYAHLWPADDQRMAESVDEELAAIARPKVRHLRPA